MSDLTYILLYAYCTLASLSCILSPTQVVTILEAHSEDAHYAYGYLLMWLVYTITLAGVLTFIVQKVSARD